MIKDTKVVMGVCIPRSLKKKIDDTRGDIPRSKYISKILEQAYNNENEIKNNLKNQWDKTWCQPVQSTTDSIILH